MAAQYKAEPVYMIGIVAELTQMHAQTIRLYEKLGLNKDYRLRRPLSPPKVQPAEIGPIPLIGSEQVSPLLEIGTKGLKRRELETGSRFGC